MLQLLKFFSPGLLAAIKMCDLGGDYRHRPQKRFVGLAYCCLSLLQNLLSSHLQKQGEQ